MLLNFSVYGYCVELMHYWNCLKEFQMDNPDEKKTKRKTREDSVAETLASGKNTMLPNLSLMLLPKGQRKGV